jgi:hypothetical protein
MADGGQALLLTISADTSKALKAVDNLNKRLSGIAPEMERNAKKAAAALETSFNGINADKFKAMLSETAALQDKLQAARKEANVAEATSLNQQLVLQERLQRAAVAQLETQLAIAKASGNNKRSAELQETLAVYQQFQKLGSVGIIGTKGLAEAHAFGAALKDAEKAAEGVNLGKAGRSIFDNARFATLEEGGAKLRIFGSALEPLGPLGIAAAAGIVAVAEAFAQAHEAVEFADGLFKAAAAAHVSTDALQEMRVAVTKAGGDASAAGPALLQFSEILGKAQEGLKGIRPFQALFGKGFSVADVKGLGGNEQALDAVVAKIQNLSSRSQQDAAISQFGLQGLAPLILAGADAWKEWREEAKAAGLVLDGEVIRRGHELNVQMDELTGKIKVDLTTAFINLGPVLVQLLGYVGAMLDKIKDFTGELHKYPALGKLLGDVAAAPLRSALGQDASGPIARDSAELFHQKNTKAQFDVAKGITESQLQAGLGPPPAPKGPGNLADLTKGAKNDFDERADAAQKELDKQLQDLANAEGALTEAVEQHAELEKRATSAARDQIFDQINEAERRIVADKGITAAKRDQLLAQYELAKAVADQVLGEKNALTDRRAEWALVDSQVAIRKQEVSALEAGLSTDAALATTAKERNAFERRLLDAQQAEAKKELDLDISRGLETGRYRPEDVDRLRTAQASTFASQNQKLDHDQEGPLDKYIQKIGDLMAFRRSSPCRPA